MNEQELNLRKTLQLTESMVAAARNSDWNDVAAMEVERGQTLASLLDESMEPGMAGSVHGLLQRILQMNNELLSLGESTRRGLALSLKQLSDKRLATNAYSRNQT